jgi:hypothetical protein
MAGKTPREIFEANGFEVNVIGMQRVKQCAERWKKAYGEDGIIGLADSRKEASGRLLKRELTQDEVIARQEARIKLLDTKRYPQSEHLFSKCPDYGYQCKIDKKMPSFIFLIIFNMCQFPWFFKF